MWRFCWIQFRTYWRAKFRNLDSLTAGFETSRLCLIWPVKVLSPVKPDFPQSNHIQSSRWNQSLISWKFSSICEKWIKVFELEIWKVWWRKCTNVENCPFRLPLAMAQDTNQTAPHLALTMFPMPTPGWEFNLSLQNPFATYLPFAVLVNVLQHLETKATGRVTISILSTI